MLSLLTCSAPRIDEYDPYGPPKPSPPRQRRASRSLSFIKPPFPNSKKGRRVSKMSIGTPEAFRHEFHIGKEVATQDTRLDLWDSARWQQEFEVREQIRAEKNSTPTPSTASSSIAPSFTAPSSTAPSTPTIPSMPTPKMVKRNSITPQKRKPVPSIIPDMPTISPFATLSAHDVPLPPSPTVEASKGESLESPPPKPLVPLLDPPRRGPSADEGEKLYVTGTVKKRWDNAMDEIVKALNLEEDADTDEPAPHT